MCISGVCLYGGLGNITEERARRDNGTYIARDRERGVLDGVIDRE